jgi:hypothetical protein
MRAAIFEKPGLGNVKVIDDAQEPKIKISEAIKRHNE